MSKRILLPVLLAGTAIVTAALAQDAPIGADLLAQEFKDPPNSARPRVWWHWMNGNITKDGIAKDLAWMKRVGIGGLQNFDANLQTPQIVENRLVYMTPGWKDAFRFAATEADRLGLEMAIAASPGWSETGGPWVKPADGLKKLVWSETVMSGGARFTAKLAAPPSVTGPFQSLPKAGGIEEMLGDKREAPPAPYYADVAVLAYPDSAAAALPTPKITDGAGNAFDPASLSDSNLEAGVAIKKSDKAPQLMLDFGKPVTVRSASLYLPGAAMMFAGAFFSPILEASEDQNAWRKVADLPSGQVPGTASFPAITARYFRVVMKPRDSVFDMGQAAPGSAMGDMFAGFAANMAGKPTIVGDFRLSPRATISRFETKAGYAIAQNYYDLGEPADQSTMGISPAQVINLTGRLKPDGTLDWTPPKGRWRVVRMGYSLLGTTNHPAPPEATGLEVDKFDGDAVKRYLDHYISMYKDAAGSDMLGKRGVRAILTDSIEVGAANWTPKMVAQFTRLRGYDPTPWLPALTGTLVGTRADSDRFLYDYRRTLADLMSSEHYGTVAKVAHENGLMVYGEALEDHRPSLGDDMTMRSHADVPMAAMWTYPRGKSPRFSYLADIKGAASVAHIYGQNLVAAESLTSAMNPWYYAPNDLKRIIDLEFVTGVNRPVIHTSVHQPVDDKVPGLSLFIFGQYFNRHESWAEMAKPWIDYISRNAFMLQQGRNAADVGYFYGEEAPLTGLYGDKEVGDAPKTSAYDFVSTDALMNVLQNDGNELVAPSGARYKLLYLGGSSHRMTLQTLKRIAALAEGGATIVGMKPESDPGRATEPTAYAALVAKLWPGGAETTVGNGRVIASTNVEAALRSMGIASQFAFSGGDSETEIPFLNRSLADGESFYLVNRKDRPETIEARFRVSGKVPEIWRAETGTSEPVSYRIENGLTIVPLEMAPEDSFHVVFRKPATANALTIKKIVPVQLTTLTGGWTVGFQKARGAPDSVILPALQPLNEHADPAIKYFSGIATYSKSFATPKGWKAGQPLWIDLGDVRELAEVSVNGVSAGGAWHAPYRVNIGAVAKAGKNTLDVKVANLWVNRLVGDQQKDAKPITYTSLPTYTAKAPLRASGLIGPVTLMGQTK